MPDFKVRFETLQPICMVMGELKQQLIEELPHFGHHGLFFQNDEITTGQLDNKTEIKINLLTGQLLYFHNEKGSFIDLKNNDILEKLKSITSEQNLKISTEPLKNTDEKELIEYHDFAVKAKQVMELFRMNLRDSFTLVHLWPHHFDFSLEWFTGNKDEQIGIGISPGDANYSFPYLYMNPWPFNEKVMENSLPIGKWHTSGWNGIMVEWADLIQFKPTDAAGKITYLFNIAKKNFA
ncbi:MAG: hypothetical protein OEQ12_02140 [Nitrosopumilus sp.]|nr:hypothetical protein [Nitrosopumilus sp.]